MKTLVESMHCLPSFCCTVFSEASYAIHARAVREYYNMQEPNHISFREGDFIRVSRNSSFSLCLKEVLYFCISQDCIEPKRFTHMGSAVWCEF